MLIASYEYFLLTYVLGSGLGFLKLTSTEEEAVKAYFMCYVKDEGESFILNKIETVTEEGG